MNGREWTLQNDKLLSRVYGTAPAKHLVRDYFPDRTDCALHGRARKLGLRADRALMTSIAKKLYTVNESFFAVPNITNSYWAGFIAADGSVVRSNTSLKIELANKDHDHLIKFRDVMMFTGHVYKRKTSVVILYGIPRVLDDLKSVFNITQRKSMTLQSPHISDEDHIRSYIRGYFDGDGSISKVSSGNTYRLSVVSGSKDMIDWLESQIQKWSGIDCTGIYPDRNHWQLVYGGSRQALSVLDWLYCDACYRLDRKYQRYLALQDRCHQIDQNASSQYKGVSWNKERLRWDAKIYVANKKIWIGRFCVEQDAARAYNAKAVDLGLSERCYVIS